MGYRETITQLDRSLRGGIDTIHQMLHARFGDQVRQWTRAHHRGVGLDIGTWSIKCVELGMQDGQYVLQYAAHEALGPHPTPEQRSETIRRLVDPLALDPPVVNVSVSGPSVVVRNERMPSMSPQELKGAMMFEVEKYIPFEVDEVVVDTYVLPKKSGDNQMQVLLVAAKRDVVHERLAWAEDAGLMVGAVDVDAFALANAFLELRAPSTNGQIVAMLNIGEHISQFDILSGGAPVFSREVFTAGRDVTRALAAARDIDEGEAEQLKHNGSISLQEQEHAGLCQVFQELAREVQICLDYHEGQGADPVQSLYLSGGGAQISGCPELLNEQLPVQVELWDPLANLQSVVPVDSDVAPRLPVAIGLAMR